ncbi:MAG: hypothetical protein LUD41_03945, partial [Phascolarctobacterium sp.]|nr:hypothetical protein [Phascolarctobacterium sp.]
MTNEEKINRIQSVIDHPGREGLYYKLLEDLGDLKGNYGDYMTTEPTVGNFDRCYRMAPSAERLTENYRMSLFRIS